MRTFFFCLLTLFSFLQITAQTAEEIVRRSEDLLKGTSSRGTFRMTITSPEYTRTMVMDSWWVGNEKALIAIKSPHREAGNKTLKVNNELWMYLRNTETTIKVPPSMMMQAWNGSDFTNDDLVRESDLVKDYFMRSDSGELIAGEMCWKIILTPKPDAPVVWGKIELFIRKKDFLPSVSTYFDEKGTPVRRLEYTNVKRFGNRTIPSTWIMQNLLKKGHHTEFTVIDAEFDLKIPERIFSFKELEKGSGR